MKEEHKEKLSKKWLAHPDLFQELAGKIWEVSEGFHKPQDVYEYLDDLRDSITLISEILFEITEDTYFEED